MERYPTGTRERFVIARLAQIVYSGPTLDQATTYRGRAHKQQLDCLLQPEMISRVLSLEVAGACSKIRRSSVVSVVRNSFLVLASRSSTSKRVCSTSRGDAQVAASNVARAWGATMASVRHVRCMLSPVLSAAKRIAYHFFPAATNQSTAATVLNGCAPRRASRLRVPSHLP